jgi:microcystin-dependent protein
MDYYLSQIVYMPFTWSMVDAVPCRGQVLPISHNEALYSLLSNRFGGDIHAGTFALPDLRPFDGIDAPDHGIRVRREWNEHEVVPFMFINGVYPSRA